MEAKTREAAEGWNWVVCGWRLFTINPGMWIALIIVFFMLAILVNLVPLVGNLAFALLGPVLTGGLIYAVSKADHGEELEMQDLFQGFKDKSRLNPLLTLGGMALLGSVLVAVVAMLAVGGASLEGMMQGGGHAMTLGAGALLGLIVALIIQTVIAMAMFFGIPLVMLGGVDAVTAAKSSFRACMINIWSLLVYGLVIMAGALVAAIPFGLGFLVLVPVTLCSVYCAYQSVYGSN